MPAQQLAQLVPQQRARQLLSELPVPVGDHVLWFFNLLAPVLHEQLHALAVLARCCQDCCYLLLPRSTPRFRDLPPPEKQGQATDRHLVCCCKDPISSYGGRGVACCASCILTLLHGGQCCLHALVLLGSAQQDMLQHSAAGSWPRMAGGPVDSQSPPLAPAPAATAHACCSAGKITGLLALKHNGSNYSSIAVAAVRGIVGL